MPPTRIAELASIIYGHTQKVDAYLVSQNLPTPSFDHGSPLKPSLPPEIQNSQEAILEACDEITALMLSPAGLVTRQPLNAWTSIQAIERFGLARSFPPGTTATFDAIARSCSIPESDTRRILRHAMTYYIFREPFPGIVEHTAASKALAEAPQLGQLTGFLSCEIWPSATRLVDAMEKWPGSEEPNEAGFSVAFGTDIPMLGVVGRDRDRARRMVGAMSFMQSGPAYSVRHVLANFQWGEASKGLLVDVGGGSGDAAIEIARFLPGIKCIVQDLPEVIEGVEVPEDLRTGERLRLMSHDFFKEQPVKGADVYFFRWVLHDWSDKYAMKILQNLMPALKNGARVVVSDLCLPDPCILSPYKERSARSFDISMKAIQNAKERDAEDWEHLFKIADPRFKFQRIEKPSGSTLSIIWASWEEAGAF